MLNNAIWRRGVAALCGLCHAYHDHIRLHFPNPLAPPHLAPLSSFPHRRGFSPRERGRANAGVGVYRRQSNVDWKILMGLSTQHSTISLSLQRRRRRCFFHCGTLRNSDEFYIYIYIPRSRDSLSMPLWYRRY